jgi:hypothetical protein
MPSLAAAVGVEVQTQANRGLAVEGGTEFILISVVVTRDSSGAPVSNLGPSVPLDPDGISLPAGWTLESGFNVRPGGCLLTPTEFTNLGNGLYDIRVVPFVANPNCAWLAGEYLYAVRLNVTVGTVTFQGSGLGKYEIPSAP